MQPLTTRLLFWTAEYFLPVVFQRCKFGAGYVPEPLGVLCRLLLTLNDLLRGLEEGRRGLEHVARSQNLDVAALPPPGLRHDFQAAEVLLELQQRVDEQGREDVLRRGSVLLRGMVKLARPPLSELTSQSKFQR